MKAYCTNCAASQPASFRPGKDQETGESYEDICCDNCHLVLVAISGRTALQAQLASGQEPVAWFDEEMQSAYVLEREILAGHEQTTPKD